MSIFDLVWRVGGAIVRYTSEIVVCGDCFGGERSKCRQGVERFVLLDLH